MIEFLRKMSVCFYAYIYYIILEGHTFCSFVVTVGIVLQTCKLASPLLRRLKDVAQAQYSQREADSAAGKTAEHLPPAHPAAPSSSESLHQLAS